MSCAVPAPLVTASAPWKKLTKLVVPAFFDTMKLLVTVSAVVAAATAPVAVTRRLVGPAVRPL